MYLEVNRNPTMFAEGVDYRVAIPKEVLNSSQRRVEVEDLLLD